MPAGRPQEHDREELLRKLLAYIAETEIPIVAEFAAQSGLYRQQLYDMPELSDALKSCISKKEGALERQALAGKVNCTMAIFSLKQLGWKDTQSHEHGGPNGGPIRTKTETVIFPNGGPGQPTATQPTPAPDDAERVVGAEAAGPVLSAEERPPGVYPEPL
jgi:hypothetical protein